MEVIILLLIGGGIYLFFKNNTRQGAEVMRAYVFLEGLAEGLSVIEANTLVASNMTEVPPEIILSAKAKINNQYGGKNLAIIADAYQKGMYRKLPNWSIAVIDAAYNAKNANIYSPAASATPWVEKTPEWIKPFVLYFVATEMRLGEMSNDLHGLLQGQVTGNFQMVLPAELRRYLDFSYPHVDRYEIEPVVREAQNFLKDTIRANNTPTAVRSFLQKENINNTGAPIPDHDMDRLIDNMQAHFSKNAEAALELRDLMLKAEVEEMFEIQHSKTFSDFSKELNAYWGKHNCGIST